MLAAASLNGAAMEIAYVDLAASDHYRHGAAEILRTAFLDKGNSAWPDTASALKEVEECIVPPNFALGAVADGALMGWVGLRPMYEKTWELHPLAVSPAVQGKGIGRALMEAVERKAKEAGIIGIALGTDDEHGRTSLSQKAISVDIGEAKLFELIGNIKNIQNHPYEFYKKCGYMIVGIIPNANGKNKPDIWMWKGLV
jgi:aminoglycoside 6'-N-acetyltransferase I